MIYDIFISYKHFSAATANNLWHRLTVKGYSVFYDKEEMGRDRFDEQLFQRIEEAKDFIVVLEKHSLDACKDGTYKEDWFCKELMFAMSKKKNIIPVLIDGSAMPSKKDLPKELWGFELIEAPDFSLSYFDAYIEKLIKKPFLLSKPSKVVKGHAVLKFRSNQECDVFNEKGEFVGKLLPDTKDSIYYMLETSGEFAFTCINSLTKEEKEIFKEVQIDEERFVNILWEKHSPTITEKHSQNSIPIQVKGVTFYMIPVKGGDFLMGAGMEQGDDFWPEEKPQHEVSLSDFLIAETPVTQELWNAIMTSNPSQFNDNRNPVENVSWNDCQKFINKLNELTGKSFSLPTEAQWEYAARGGQDSKGYKYSGSNSLISVGWSLVSRVRTTQCVKTKDPNELGIYDMSGNVWEWCLDKYYEYNRRKSVNPIGTSATSHHIRRGGCWAISARHCRVTSRDEQAANHRSPHQGFRLVLNGFDSKKIAR